MGESLEKVGKLGVVSVTKIPRGARSAYLQLDQRSFLMLQDVTNLVQVNRKKNK
jgi:hypothetical protein